MIGFLKNVLIPETIKNYFIFPADILVIEIDELILRILKLHVQGEKRTLIEYRTVTIEDGPPKTVSDRIADALTKLRPELGTYTKLIYLLPSSLIIFKEFSLPFLDEEKIAQVLPFEMESQLPIPLSQTTMQFICTATHTEEGRSDLLVSVAQNSIIEASSAPFLKADLVPQEITIFPYTLHRMITQLLPHLLDQSLHLLLDITASHTTVMMYVKGQLRLVRILPYGSFALFQKSESQKSGDRYTEKMQKLRNDLVMTIKIAAAQYASGSFSILGVENDNDLSDFIARELQLTFVPLLSIVIAAAAGIEHGTLQEEYVRLLIASIPFSETRSIHYTLQDAHGAQNFTLFLKQMGTAVTFILILLLMLFTSYRSAARGMKQEIAESEKEVITALRAEFEIPAEEKKFDDVLEFAQQQVKKKREMWLAFSNQARTSLLQYLLDLTERIDKASLDFKLEKLSFEQNKLILKAEVRDYEALKILERELRQSKLFSYVEPQDNPRFTMIITLAPIGEGE
jgi:hypothetical protein